jgi:hypothetical protein
VSTQGNTVASTARSQPASPGASPARRQFAVFTIVEQDDKALWRRVGSGFVNRDGSFNLYLDALPVNGRLHMREVDNAPLNPERS